MTDLLTKMLRHVQIKPLLVLNIIGVCCLSCKAGTPSERAGSTSTVDGATVSAVSVPPSAIPPTTRTGAAPRVRNVVLLSIDSLRADMPWSGYPRDIAPRLTELAKRSTVYTHAYAVSSYTSMSLGGLLGGRYPSELRRNGFFFGTYGKENLFFPEILQANHVRTLGAHAHGYFKDAGFEQGFDRWEVLPNLKWNNTTDENVTSPAHEALAEKMLSEVGGERFFAWFHFLDPHDQYLSHEKDGIASFGNTPRDRYDAEVLFTDRHVGKLLDFIAAAPWGKETAIVVTADHGEAFGEHGQMAHGFELWENLVRVPLIVNLPGQAPRTIDTPRSAIDLAPTMLELFDVAPEPTFVGRGLAAEWRGGAAEVRQVVLDLPMTSDNDRRRALVNGSKKVISFGSDNILKGFDLAADPFELTPVKAGEWLPEAFKGFAEVSKTVKETPPTACNVGCLNGAYAKPKSEKAE